MGKNSRILIGGTGSSAGKTTVTCGLIKALKNKGENIAAFKCGPDYIDPMFHEAALGVPSANLDLFLCGKDGVLNILGKKGEGKLSVIEGVMGFYDGLGGISPDYSSHDLSRATNTPAILVTDCKGKSLSLGAEIKGFLDFLPNNIKGVILNGVTPSAEKMYQNIIENNTNAKVYGFLPKIDDIHFKSRHLGLVTAAEISDITKKIEIIAENTAKYIDLNEIITTASDAPPINFNEINIENMGYCRISIAKDEAFCFYYKENLEILEKYGAKIDYFSPLHDEKVPGDSDCIIFGGGYPELYLDKLSKNEKMKTSVKNASLAGTPIWAECGGFLYLLEKYTQNGISYPLCSLLQGEGYLTEKLVRFGYSKLTALENTLLLGKDEEINAHEFHYSDSTCNGDAFLAAKASGAKKWKCVYADGNIFAGYPHIHFYGNLKAAENLIDACLSFRKAKKGVRR